MTIKLDEAAIVEGYLDGKSLRQLAEEYGVSVQPICRVLRNNEVETHTGRVRGKDRRPRAKRSTARGMRDFSGDEITEMVSLYEGGMLQRDLAKRFGCSPGTISTTLRRAGVPPRLHGQRGKDHHQWRGGRSVADDGTVWVYVDQEDPIAVAMAAGRRYLPEYRLVMAHHLGRPLTSEEQVHHKNDDHSDSRIENLQLRSGPHGKGAAFRCRSCGSTDVEAVALEDR